MAALLYAAGHQVLLCGRTPRAGIELRPDGANPIVVPGPVHTDPDQVVVQSGGPVDVLILAVKATQNDRARDWLANLCDGHTIVAVLQNGIEQVEQVQPYCPTSTVVPAIVWYVAETQPRGWVRLRSETTLVVPTGPAAEKVAKLLRGAGATVDCDPDFITASWRKLLVNALAGFMALSGRRSGMFRRQDIAGLSRRYLAECLAVARAEGARIGNNAIDEMIDQFRSAPVDMPTSMLTDREERRPLEWDLRNGVIVRKARTHGLATPISDVLVPLLAAASDGPG